MIEAGLRGHPAVPRAVRFTLEGVAIAALAGALAWLALADAARRGPLLPCPPNISQAVQAATACTPASDADEE